MKQVSKNNRGRQRSGRRSGGGNGGGGGGHNLNRVYESNGPEGKVRGTAQQIIDKYSSLGRDAMTSGDRIIAENFFQHAEHYQRIVSAALAAEAEAQERRAQQHAQQQAERERRAEDGQNRGERNDEARSGQNELQESRTPRNNGSAHRSEPERAVQEAPEKTAEDAPLKPANEVAPRKSALGDDPRAEAAPEEPVAERSEPLVKTEAEAKTDNDVAPKPARRRRTAAAKKTTPEPDEIWSPADVAAAAALNQPDAEEAPKPRRGRPRKKPVEDAPAEEPAK